MDSFLTKRFLIYIYSYFFPSLILFWIFFREVSQAPGVYFYLMLLYLCGLHLALTYACTVLFLWGVAIWMVWNSFFAKIQVIERLKDYLKMILCFPSICLTDISSQCFHSKHIPVKCVLIFSEVLICTVI